MTSVERGRSGALDAVDDALADTRGVLLVGPAGIGKSYLADAAADRRAARGECVVRIRATSGSTELPLGAFAAFLDHIDRPAVSMFVDLRRRLSAQADGRPLLFVIDDVNLLDDSSASLVHQFVADGNARMVSSIRLGQFPPSGIEDLVQRGLVRRQAVEPLDAPGVRLTGEQVLGARLDDPTVARILAVTAGNALFVKELLLAAVEHGSVTRTGNTASIPELPTGSDRLHDLVRGRLAGLAADDLEALRHIAFAEPCEPSELTSSAPFATLGRLESAGVISSAEDRGRLVIRLAHPIYGEVLRSTTGLLQRRAILAALATDLRAAGTPRRPTEIIKLARLAVDGGVDIAPEVLRKAMAPTIQAGHLDLAERIGRRLLDTTQEFYDGIELGRALQYKGDEEGLREHLVDWGRLARTDGEHRAVALAASTCERMLGTDVARADALVEAAAQRYPSDDSSNWFPVGVAELRAENWLLQVGSRSNDELTDLIEPLTGHPRASVRIRAFTGSGMVHCYGRRAELARERIHQAVDELRALGIDNALTPVAVFSYEALAEVAIGDVAAAERLMTDVFVTASDDGGFAIASIFLAVVRALAGRPVSGLQTIESYADRWDRVRGFVQPRHCWAVRLLCAATSGDLTLARHAAGEYERDRGCLRTLDMFADLGRIRLLAASGRPVEAAELARRQAEHWRALGLDYAEAYCRYELVRLGDLAGSDRLAELADSVEGRLVAEFFAHAEASRADDPERLVRVSERFDEMGLVLYASEAAMQASDAFRRRHDQRAANRQLSRAAELRGRCEATTSSSPVLDTGTVALSKREREVALLAAQGMTSRDIAERLFISFRTAENHLAKAYDKLGVRTRAELSRVLDGGVAALVA